MSSHIKAGWEIVKATARALREDKVSVISSGVAFRVMLAVFPGAVLLVWLLKRIVGEFGPDKVIALAAAALPASASAIIEKAARSPLVAEPSSGSPVGSIIPFAGLLFMLWTANGGMKALFDALNMIYDSRERRSFVRFHLVTIASTLAFLLFLILVVGLAIAVPYLLPASLGAAEIIGLKLVRWPVLFVCIAGALAILYRVAPCRGRRTWPLITIGSATAALSLMAMSSLFSWTIHTFASLSITYGSLSTIVAFMIWLWVSFSLCLRAPNWMP